MADQDNNVLIIEGGITKRLKATDRLVLKSSLAFEGSTDNSFETELAFTDPTDDRTITFPDEDGDIALLQGGHLPNPTSFPVKNPSVTDTLSKGTVVFINGHSGTKPTISKAQSSMSSLMPAFGLVAANISPEAEGYVINSGLIKGIDTSLYSVGDTLYVSSATAGEFTNSAPTGTSLIQNIGKVVRSDASNGEIMVGGAGRTAATPNLSQGQIFLGDASNQSSIGPYTFPTTDGSANQILKTDDNGALSFTDITDVVMVELSIPGVDIQTDTNAFRFNCPYALTVTGLDLYLDQHTTSGNVTVTVTNTTDTASMISLSVAGTSTSATTTTVSNASCDAGDIITFAITATPANAQGLRANLKFTRTV